MKRILFSTWLLGCLVLLPLAVQAEKAKPKKAEVPKVQSELGIIAVVNDEVITSMEVGDRARFIVHTAKLTNTPETLGRLAPQVTRQLIDEALQMQQARRLGIQVSDEELKKVIEEITVSRGGSTEALRAQLKTANVPFETFEDQIRAQLAFSKVVNKEVRSRVKVSDEEVELARLQESTALNAAGSSEVQIITLSLPVDKPEHDAEVKALAEKLIGDLRGGASFQDMVSQFGNNNVPDPVWTPLSQIEPNLAKALEKAVPGSVSNPTRTPSGYMIVKLLNRRSVASAAVNDSQLLLKEMLLKLKPDETEDNAKLSLGIAREVARYPGDCKSPTVAGVSGLNESDIQVKFIEARFSELSATIQQMVASLSVGGVTEPFATPDGIRLMMLCERIDAPPVLADAEATYTRLMNQKMELEAQKYMRNLRRDAFIELRAGQ
jgi:peptidyl-prolyl cis-trans isomerase SurA